MRGFVDKADLIETTEVGCKPKGKFYTISLPLFAER